MDKHKVAGIAGTIFGIAIVKLFGLIGLAVLGLGVFIYERCEKNG